MKLKLEELSEPNRFKFVRVSYDGEVVGFIARSDRTFSHLACSYRPYTNFREAVRAILAHEVIRELEK